MKIILGATGQIGSMLVDNLLKEGQQVRAVVRDSSKAQKFEDMGAEVFIADYSNGEAVKKAFYGGDSVFLLTPENPQCVDCLNEIRTIIDNYREAVLVSEINRIVGLSSMGAHLGKGTGNLMASHMLEHAFTDVEINQVFVRPAYYYSNWLGYLETVKEYGVLPTFFPPEMKLPMIAPSDVAQFLSDIMTCKSLNERIYEIAGPNDYSSLEIARIFEDLLKREVTSQQVLPEEWESTLLQAGFSEDSAKNLMLMTQAVINGKARSETGNLIRCSTDFRSYLEKFIEIPLEN